VKPFAIVPGDSSPLGRARLSLEGLSVGDAFGERFFVSPSLVESRIDSRAIPAPPWYWTDDTAMALSIFEHLRERGRIDQERLAQSFATRYRRDPRRGYGGTAHGILTAISLGEPWQEAAGSVFDGQGSMGNGGGMRAAPIGGYFADDLAAVVAHARASAEPTHAHPDGQAGAIAVAAAAAFAWRIGAGQCESASLLREVAALTPSGATRDGIEKAAALPFSSDVRAAVAALGNGSQVISSDTVPFALWCAARHIDDFEEALWSTVSGLGDRDTTCAMVGGIVALAVGHAGIPRAFVEAREPLDSNADYLERHAEEVRLGRRPR
jgi:ADP-ribosylglycohydrolase